LFGIRRTSVLCILAAVFATAASAQSIAIGKDMSILFKGFISATAFAQDQEFQFGNGQNAEWPEPPEATVDRWFGGGDVRNTRLTLVFSGPKVLNDWRVNATGEMDFFGGHNGTGAFAGQQPVPRLRLAYMELTNGSTTIQLGQQWAPLWGNLPVSVTHLSFPLGWASGGLIGWRYPGLFVNQKLTKPDAPVKMDLQFAVMGGNWNGPESTTDNETAGNATWPQFELRYNAGGKLGEVTWSAYLVGHIDEKDLSGPGVSAPNDKLSGSAVEIGAKFQLGDVLIQGNGFTGHAIGEQFSTINQFGKIQSEGGLGAGGLGVHRSLGHLRFRRNGQSQGLRRARRDRRGRTPEERDVRRHAALALGTVLGRHRVSPLPAHFGSRGSEDERPADLVLGPLQLLTARVSNASRASPNSDTRIFMEPWFHVAFVRRGVGSPQRSGVAGFSASVSWRCAMDELSEVRDERAPGDATGPAAAKTPAVSVAATPFASPSPAGPGSRSRASSTSRRAGGARAS
jgi:hypothetical protein